MREALCPLKQTADFYILLKLFKRYLINTAVKFIQFKLRRIKTIIHTAA